MKDIIFTRESLHQLLWSYPLPVITKRYDVTYRGLKDIYEGMDIPVPQKEYWQNRDLGSTKAVEPLPQSDCRKTQATLQQWEEGDENRPEYEASYRSLVELVKANKGLPVFSGKPKNTDPIVLSSQSVLEKKNRHRWACDLVYSFAPNLDITVSPENVTRVLLFADTLMKLLRMRGHCIQVEGKDTNVVIGGQKLKVCFRERLRMEKEKDRTYFMPTSILLLKCEALHAEREWVDGSERVESKIPQILYDLELRAVRLRERELYWQRYWDAQKEVEKQENNRWERKEKELADFKELLDRAHRWRESAMLREYLDKLEANAVSGNVLTAELREWLVWARRKADWYDPLKSSADELLSGLDMNTLSFKR